MRTGHADVLRKHGFRRSLPPAEPGIAGTVQLRLRRCGTGCEINFLPERSVSARRDLRGRVRRLSCGLRITDNILSYNGLPPLLWNRPNRPRTVLELTLWIANHALCLSLENLSYKSAMPTHNSIGSDP